MNPSSKRKRDEASFDVPICKRPKYDLFLHYSSEDIGKSFISFVKGTLIDGNGFTISGNPNLLQGQEELSKAIEESEIIVLVFSMNYASSVSCLDELVNIMNYKDKKKLFPVFFGVDPSDVRNQDGLYFNKAFEAHKNKFDGPRVQKWRDALKAAGQLSGEHYRNGDEYSFIREIVKKLKSMQDPQQLYVTDHPVGIESQVEDIISCLKLETGDVSLVAVLGISGIGKTTIAKAVYNKIAAKFEASCFLEVVGYDPRNPESMRKMQKKLISSLSRNDKPPMIHNCHEGTTKIRRFTRVRKVILVLDDVTEVEQLKILGINPFETSLLNQFFGDGSRIIVTTRDKGSLGKLSYVSYNTRLLNTTESIELFTRLAYKKYETIDTDLVNEIAYCSSGLPLVLEVWGLYFGNLEREQWPNALKTLRKIPHDDVHKKLKFSYDSLTDSAKKLFLDIACFFDGTVKDLIVKVLQDEQCPTFFWSREIRCLANKGLVIIRTSTPKSLVLMHHAIREMGQEIVRQENKAEPGQRTRLTNHMDVLRVLKEFLGTQLVESIRQGHMTVHIDAFRKMNNLRFIRLDDVALCSDPRNTFRCDCDCMSPLSFPKLKYLEWDEFPMESINIDMCNVVVVKLGWSHLTTLWNGSKCLKKLKILDVSGSYNLINTGNFIGLENLEELDFSLCKNLEELDSTVWCLDKLVKLDLEGCKRLKRFPASKMELGKLRSLRMLDLSGCESIGFEDDEVIKHFMSSLKETHITSLMLNGCKIRKVPSEIGSLTLLKHLYLYDNDDLRSLPDSLVQLDQLETLNLERCSSLQSIPDLPRSICEVIASECKCLTSLPSNMAELTSLKKLDLSDCLKLGIEDPECLMKLTGLTSLTTLNMGCCNVSQVPCEIGNLVSLHTLSLAGNTFSSLPDSFSNLLQLRHLSINDCSKLTSLPLLPPSLKKIEALGCKSLDVMRTASDELCGCPTPAVYMPFPYYKISKCVLAEYREASFHSRLHIQLSYEEEEFPIWCHVVFRDIILGGFMAPEHLDRKICGIILCLRNGYDYCDAKLQNKTKGTSCHLARFQRGDTEMCIMFYPLDNTTLMVEAGDTLVILIQGRSSLGCGVCLIYKEGDEMEAVEPTTTPFNFNPPIPNHVTSDDDDDQLYKHILQHNQYNRNRYHYPYFESDDNSNNSDGGDLHKVKIPDDANYHPFFYPYTSSCN